MKKTPQTLAELYQKYQHSGSKGHPVIRTRELKRLIQMMKQVEDLMKLVDPIRCSLLLTRHSIANMLDSRGAEVSK